MSTTTQTTIIGCDCTVCAGRQAEISGDGVTYGTVKVTRTVRHNLVALAHGPLGRAASVREHGPWAVRAEDVTR